MDDNILKEREYQVEKSTINTWFILILILNFFSIGAKISGAIIPYNIFSIIVVFWPSWLTTILTLIPTIINFIFLIVIVKKGIKQYWIIFSISLVGFILNILLDYLVIGTAFDILNLYLPD